MPQDNCSFDDEVWITHQFVPASKTRHAWYLSNPDSSETYSFPIIGTMVQHQVQCGHTQPHDSMLVFAVMEPDGIHEMTVGVTHIGIYDAGTEPTAAEIENQREEWAVYLREQEARTELRTGIKAAERAHYDAMKDYSKTDAEREQIVQQHKDTIAALHEKCTKAINSSRSDRARREAYAARNCAS